MALIEIHDRNGRCLAAADDLSGAILQLVDTIGRYEQRIRDLQPELEAALQAWLTGFDHLTNEDLMKRRPDDVSTKDAALVLAARAARPQ